MVSIPWATVIAARIQRARGPAVTAGERTSGGRDRRPDSVSAMAADAPPRRPEALDVLVERAESDALGLRRSFGVLSLTAIGVATVVGSGIFVLVGEAAARYAGPAVALSFVLAGVAGALSALCYAELAAMVPVAGSTYSYAYATLGTLAGWVIGWDLLLEYLLGAAAVSAGWSGYAVNVLDGMGLTVPASLANAPVQGAAGALVNLPALVLVALVAGLLLLGARESARATVALVAIKLTVLVAFVAVGIGYVKSANLTPFVPAPTGGFGEFGWGGVLRAAGTVFYAYIGFDVVCTAAQEARNPRRTVPAGLLVSLGVATLLYVAIALVLTGMIDYRRLDVADPIAVALQQYPALEWLRAAVDVAAVVGLAGGVVAVLYAQTRILMRMAEDGMLPPALARVDARRGVPRASTYVCAGLCAVIAALLPIDLLASLISIGTLLAFVVVSAAVLVLRRTRPDLERRFRVPFGPVIPVAAMLTALVVMSTLPGSTWLRLVVWLVLGLAIYFGYARARSRRVLDERLAG
jgi:APA family basic amino acid/polyamine antiporter